MSVQAEGRSDGRITVSVTNRTHKPLRVVLPPGIIAQSATGQMGGMMGGMGGGGMGGMGGMGGGGMGGGMGGGSGGMGGGMGGGMRGGGGTMPPMMGLMTLGRLIMYFCGEYDSWDMRSLMISMMMRGGMMGGGMGGMGGGMGGMGGGMGGMGGGMRSVPAHRPALRRPQAQPDPPSADADGQPQSARRSGWRAVAAGGPGVPRRRHRRRQRQSAGAEGHEAAGGREGGHAPWRSS